MDSSDNFKERALQKIRGEKASENSQRKRRLSKIFLAVDAVIILFVILFFYDGNSREEAYYSTKLDYKKTQFRFSVATEKKSNSYIFSLSVKSNLDKENQLSFDNSIARVQVLQQDDIVVDKTLGKGISSIKLLPAEIKTFAENIDFTVLNDYIAEHGDKLKVRRRSLIQFRSQAVPFQAKLVLNTGEKITATVDFKHGVSQ